MRRAGSWLALVTVLAGLEAFGESRFGRRVVKLANPKQYGSVKMDGNQYALLAGERAAVACIVYRGTQYYYVETAVLNRGEVALELDKDFVVLQKPGHIVVRADPVFVAANLLAEAMAAGVSLPPPRPAPTVTTINATAIHDDGSMTSVYGTARTQPDPWYGFGQSMGFMIGQLLMGRTGRHDRNLASLVLALHPSMQSLTIEPGNARLYLHVFQQIKSKKAPFNVVVFAGQECFIFRYNE